MDKDLAMSCLFSLAAKSLSEIPVVQPGLIFFTILTIMLVASTIS